MRTMMILTTLMAVCLIALPMMFGKNFVSKDFANGDKAYKPSQMEEQQDLQPLQSQPLQEGEEESAESSAENTGKADAASANWKPFRILNRSTGEIEEVAVKDYVTGALCSEMPAVFDTQALKAQAVSAHTWALYCQQAAQKNGDEYDFSADPQNWQGYVTKEQAQERFGEYFEEYWGKVSRAADAVWQEIVVDEQQQPIVAAYHAISSGRTESAENVWGNPLPYLTPVESEGDIHAQGYQKEVTFSAQELKECLQNSEQQPTLSDDPASWLSVLERSGSGYVTWVRVGDTQMSGIELRELLGLRSSDFDISFQNGVFTFTTLGYGHGVGLSQYGADYLARQGMNYQEILEHYYTGAKVVNRSA